MNHNCHFTILDAVADTIMFDYDQVVTVNSEDKLNLVLHQVSMIVSQYGFEISSIKEYSI